MPQHDIDPEWYNILFVSTTMSITKYIIFLKNCTGSGTRGWYKSNNAYSESLYLTVNNKYVVMHTFQYRYTKNRHRYPTTTQFFTLTNTSKITNGQRQYQKMIKETFQLTHISSFGWSWSLRDLLIRHNILWSRTDGAAMFSLSYVNNTDISQYI